MNKFIRTSDDDGVFRTILSQGFFILGVLLILAGFLFVMFKNLEASRSRDIGFEKQLFVAINPCDPDDLDFLKGVRAAHQLQMSAAQKSKNGLSLGEQTKIHAELCVLNISKPKELDEQLEVLEDLADSDSDGSESAIVLGPNRTEDIFRIKHSLERIDTKSDSDGSESAIVLGPNRTKDIFRIKHSLERIDTKSDSDGSESAIVLGPNRTKDIFRIKHSLERIDTKSVVSFWSGSATPSEALKKEIEPNRSEDSGLWTFEYFSPGNGNQAEVISEKVSKLSRKEKYDVYVVNDRKYVTRNEAGGFDPHIKEKDYYSDLTEILANRLKNHLEDCSFDFLEEKIDEGAKGIVIFVCPCPMASEGADEFDPWPIVKEAAKHKFIVICCDDWNRPPVREKLKNYELAHSFIAGMRQKEDLNKVAGFQARKRKVKNFGRFSYGWDLMQIWHCYQNENENENGTLTFESALGKMVTIKGKTENKEFRLENAERNSSVSFIGERFQFVGSGKTRKVIE